MATNKQAIEEGIGWQLFRAASEAMTNLANVPELPHGGDAYISVEVRLLTPTWPGEHASGRGKSTILANPSCVYRLHPEEDRNGQ